MPPRLPPAAAGSSCGDLEIRGASAKAAGPLHVHTYVSTRRVSLSGQAKCLIRCGDLVGR